MLRRAAELIVVHVVQPPPFITHGEMAKALEQAEGYRRELQEQLCDLRRANPDLSMECRLADGDPLVEILRAAAESNCDLIVLGTHGRTGFRRLLLGSVAEQVLRRAPCPVLSVTVPYAESKPGRIEEKRETTAV